MKLYYKSNFFWDAIHLDSDEAAFCPPGVLFVNPADLLHLVPDLDVGERGSAPAQAGNLRITEPIFKFTTRSALYLPLDPVNPWYQKRIRIRLRILLFSLVTFKMASFFAY
jgi:hypothetical protein